MIRIGVMSDSHGRLSHVTRAVREMGHVDQIVHLGDHDSDASEAGKVSDAPLAVVCGNCDWFSQFPAERLLELGGVRVLLTPLAKKVVELISSAFIIWGLTRIGKQNEHNEIVAEAVWANPGLAGIAYWQYFDTRTCGRECTKDGKKHVAMSFAGLFDCYRRPKRVVQTLTEWFRRRTPANLLAP